MVIILTMKSCCQCNIDSQGIKHLSIVMSDSDGTWQHLGDITPAITDNVAAFDYNIHDKRCM